MKTCTMPRSIQSAAEIEHEHESTDVWIDEDARILDRPDTPGWHEDELPDHSPAELAEMLDEFEDRR